jgi:hypothetical protein
VVLGNTGRGRSPSPTPSDIETMRSNDQEQVGRVITDYSDKVTRYYIEHFPNDWQNQIASNLNRKFHISTITPSHSPYESAALDTIGSGRSPSPTPSMAAQFRSDDANEKKEGMNRYAQRLTAYYVPKFPEDWPQRLQENLRKKLGPQVQK